MELYDTRTLVGVIDVQKPPEVYWLQWFPGVLTFETQDIMFDMIAPNRRLAPFVAPNVQGRIMRRRGSTAKVFRPAYAKPKHSVDPSQTIPRRAGERIAGELSLQQRYDAIVAENMFREKEYLTRLFEWMAAKALIDGEVTIAGDDYPTQTVSFGRDASLTVVLASGARWDQAGTSHPLVDIEAAVRASYELANTPIDRLTFGLTAWSTFSKHADITPLLSTQNRGSDTEYNRAVPSGAPYQYMGSLSGQGGMGRLELYTYNCLYEDENNALQPFMDQKTVVGTGSGIQGVRCFGAIMDFDAGLTATEMFPKMWREQDPSQAFTMTQSAPLMVPAQPNGCFKIKVQS